MLAQRIVVGLFVSLIVLSGCGKRELEVTTPVNNTDPRIEQKLGEANAPYVVMGEQAFMDAKASRAVVSAKSKSAISFLSKVAKAAGLVIKKLLGNADNVDEPAANSLVVGFPIGLLGEQQLFGGVITKTSAKDSETLGRLKLMDLTPLHVRTVVAKGEKENEFVFGLVGCVNACAEGSEQKALVGIPIVGVDEKGQSIFLDLSSLGSQLNLVEILDPDGSYTKLKTKTAKTVAVDYSVSTLVFDVEVTMVPVEVKSDVQEVPETTFTIRWYLRLASKFHPEFVARDATQGVGYFMTERSKTPKIQRHLIPSQGTGGLNAETVKYFIKNVPQEHKKAFAASFDAWNNKFVVLTGKKLIAYEFVDATDPRADKLVTGDVRYNILEWDLVNRAPYGGLGPSIANQFTGEILSSNVLVQGPHIVKIYKEWFETAKKVKTLMEEGAVIEALSLMREGDKALKAMLEEGSSTKFKVSLGELGFRDVSQQASLEDPIMQREDFDLFPSGYTFETYMEGYWLDLVAHELGHNLGLRHNFRGNLSFSALEKGKVSHSIMEYLGRGFRHLDDVGVYDVIALKYGYLGVAPENRTLFCTDEDVPDAEHLTNSAECSRDDATNDPYGFLEARLERAVGLLIGRSDASATLWKVDDMKRELSSALPAIAMYAATAEKTAATWTNFNVKSDRPKVAAEIVAFVKESIRSKVCPKDLADVLKGKSEAAKAQVLENLAGLKKLTLTTLAPLKVISDADLACE